MRRPWPNGGCGARRRRRKEEEEEEEDEEEEEEEEEETSSWNSLCRMTGPVFKLVLAMPKSYSKKRAP